MHKIVKCLLYKQTIKLFNSRLFNGNYFYQGVNKINHVFSFCFMLKILSGLVKTQKIAQQYCEN